MNTVYLSRRNLLTLLKKLDGIEEGIPSSCTIIKCDTVNDKYLCSDITSITAVEDKEYYGDRAPGGMRTREEDFLKNCVKE